MPLVAFLGSDYRRKGIDTLLAALARLPGAHAFVIGGERAERRAAFESEARAAGLAARIHWLGVQPEPQRWLAAADLMLFPTRFDAFGSAVLEALACGVPAVVSRRAGAAELVTEGKTGVGARRARATAPPGPRRRARSSIRRGARSCARSRARAPSAIPGATTSQRVLEVYRELLGGSPRGHSGSPPGIP